MTQERLSELRQIAMHRTDVRQASLPDLELLELVDMAALALQMLPASCRKIERRYQRSRFSRKSAQRAVQL